MRAACTDDEARAVDVEPELNMLESLRVIELMVRANVVLVYHEVFGENGEFPAFPISFNSRD